MKTTVQKRLALLAGLLVLSLLVVGVSAQAALASVMEGSGSGGGGTAVQAASSGSAASSSVSSVSVKVPQTLLQSRRLLDAWAGQGQLGIVPVPPGVRGPLFATASGGGLSRGTSVAVMIGTAVTAALLIGSIAVAGSKRKQQQPECVGEGCSGMA